MKRLGFTLIEVMVAVAILGIGLASLFTSQVGAIKVAQRARNTTVATLLARCKMAEVEERIHVDGLPYDDLSERDECCEDMEREGFECEWSVERIVLPDQVSDEEGGEGLLDALGGGDDEGSGGGEFDPTSAGPEDLGNLLSGETGGGGGILDMVTQMTFPVLKPIIEEQVRRINVTVSWNEGSKEHSFNVAQFYVSEVGAPPPDPQVGQEGEGEGEAAPGAGNPSGGPTAPGVNP